MDEEFGWEYEQDDLEAFGQQESWEHSQAEMADDDDCIDWDEWDSLGN